MTTRITNTTRLNAWAVRSLNIQDDSDGYYIFMCGRKLLRKTQKELLLVLSKQTDETILSLIKQNSHDQLQKSAGSD